MNRLLLVVCLLLANTPAKASWCPPKLLALAAIVCIGAGCSGKVKDTDAPAVPVGTPVLPGVDEVKESGPYTLTPATAVPLDAQQLRALTEANLRIPKSLSWKAREEIQLLTIQVDMIAPAVGGNWREAVDKTAVVLPQYRDLWADHGMFFDGLTALATGAKETPELVAAIRTRDINARIRIQALLQGAP